jgi:hypothetical protein
VGKRNEVMVLAIMVLSALAFYVTLSVDRRTEASDHEKTCCDLFCKAVDRPSATIIIKNDQLQCICD